MASWGAVLYPFLVQGGRIVALLAAALIAVRLSDAFFGRFRGRLLASMMERAAVPGPEIDKRAATISEMLRKTLKTLIYGGAIMMALREARFDIGPLLAGAGVAGIAIGLGAQTLVRDMIGGVFILLENQIRVDDYVAINGTAGRVEELNLRTTVLRGNNGTVHVFRNGAINTLSNMTWDHSSYLFSVRTSYKEDPDRVAEVLKELGDELRREEPYTAAIIGPLEVLGVDQLADVGFVTQARFQTRPMLQWMVGREMNRRIKKKFTELGIELK